MNTKLCAAVQAASILTALLVPALATAGDWDAIAVSDARGSAGANAGYGVGTGNNQAEAIAGALSACQKANNSGCRVMLVYSGRDRPAICGAYASSPTKWGAGLGDNEDAARVQALSACGEGSCQMAVSDCVGK